MFIHNKYIVLNIIQPLWLCHQNYVKLFNAIYYGSFFLLKLVSAVYTPTQWAPQIWFESGENFKSSPCKTFS